MVHPQVLSNVKHKCFCFVCRSFVRARATEQPSYHTSFQISACLDSTRRALPRLATTRFVSTPPCRDTTPHASYHTVLRFQFFLLTRSLRLLSPPNCSTVLRTNDETNRFRYLYPFSHLDILFSYSTPCIVNDKFAILKNTLSERR